MTLCINCKHCYVPYTYHPGELGGWREEHTERAVCLWTEDYVTGSGTNRRLCSGERNDNTRPACGPLAINFEPLPPHPPPLPPQPRRAKWFKRWLTDSA